MKPDSAELFPASRNSTNGDETLASHSGIVPCGFPSLTPMLRGGFRPGDLVVLGGDAGSGTTSLALAFALRAAAAGQPSAMLSAEYTPARLFERALAATARVPLDDLRRDSLDASLAHAVRGAADHLRERAPALHMLGADGVRSLESAAELHRDVRLLVIDGLEGLLSDPAARDDALAHAVLQCKRLALARGFVVLLVSHLPLLDRRRSNVRPQLADFGVHGAVAVHADVVFGLYREELYSDDPGLDGGAELHVLKSREGPRGYVDLYFAKAPLRFEDVMEG